MANPNYVYCSETALRNRQIPFPTEGGGGEEQQNSVAGGPHYQWDYFAGHPFPGLVGAEMMRLWSSCVYDHEAENGGGVHEVAADHVKRKKTKLTSEQVEALEKSFEEDIELVEKQGGRSAELRKNRVKLELKRKMNLSKELGLHPRQVATWFQNRRARLKGKHIERLYNELKQDYENVSRENQHLQQEVVELKDKLEGLQSMQDSTGYMEHGSQVQQPEYNVVVTESTRTSIAVQSSNGVEQGRTSNSNTVSERNSYLCSNEADYYSTASFPYWNVSQEYP